LNSPNSKNIKSIKGNTCKVNSKNNTLFEETLNNENVEEENIDNKFFINETPYSKNEVSNKVIISNETTINDDNTNKNENDQNVQITDSNSNNTTDNENNDKNNCDNSDNNDNKENKNMGPIMNHIYNMLKSSIVDMDKYSYRSSTYFESSINNITKLYRDNFHKSIDLSNNDVSIYDMPLGAGKRFLAINDTTEPSSGIIQLENIYNKNRYENENIEIYDTHDCSFLYKNNDPITFSKNKLTFFRIKKINLINNIINILNNNNYNYLNHGNYNNNYYYTDSELVELEYDMLDDLKKLLKNSNYYDNNYYSLQNLIDKFNNTEKIVKSDNTEISDKDIYEIKKIIKDIESIEFIINFFNNAEDKNGKSSGDSKVLLKLLLYAQTFAPVADDPSDFCVDNVHIIPDIHDYMVLDPNINIKNLVFIHQSLILMMMYNRLMQLFVILEHF